MATTAKFSIRNVLLQGTTSTVIDTQVVGELATGTKFTGVIPPFTITDLVDPADTLLISGVNYSFPKEYVYRYTTVTGCNEGFLRGQMKLVEDFPIARGEIVPLQKSVYYPEGTAGTIDIVQTNFYITEPSVPHVGGGGKVQSLIQTFDEVTNSPIAESCIASVVPAHPDPTQLNTTPTPAFSVTAKPHLTNSSLIFDGWMIITDGANQNIPGVVLPIPANSEVFALAFYKQKPIVKIPIKEGTKETGKDKDGLKDGILEVPPHGVTGLTSLTTGLAAGAIAAKLEQHEGKTNESGSAFIKQENRPEVGKAITNDANKRK